MEITLTIKGATPAEVREALLKLYNEGQPGPVAEPQPVEVEDSVVEKIVEDVKPVQPARRKWAYNKVKWTKEIEDFIMKRSHLTDSAITEELFRHFRVNCSTSAVNHRLQRIRANTPREIYIDGVFIKHWTD